MSKHFIKEIEIKNFKLFKDFKASGFGRVNLISGKNNVGKTAFMEACFVNMYAQNINYFITSLYFIEYARNYIEYVDNDEPKVYEILEKISDCNIKTNIREANFDIKKNNSNKIYQILDNNLTKKDFSQDYEDYDYIDNILFLDNFGFKNIDFKNEYGAIQSKDKEELLNQYLNQFDFSIEKFKIIQDKPKCKLKNGKYQEINDFGYGLKEYIAIIISIFACENGYLFIDEVANGIHYSQYDKVWEIILTLSKEQNVQVFATTHSKEVIESFARVTKKLKEKDISFIDLGKNKKNRIKAIVMDSERLYRELEVGNEVRGW